MSKKKKTVGRPRSGQKCSRCNAPLTEENAYKRRGTNYFTDKCRVCNKDVQIINKYVRLGETSAREAIANHYRIIELIEESIHKLNIIKDQKEVQDAIERSQSNVSG